MAKDEEPWSALLLNAARIHFERPEAHPVELIADYCRLLDEGGWLVTGRTERESVELLCANNNITFSPK